MESCIWFGAWCKRLAMFGVVGSGFMVVAGPIFAVVVAVTVCVVIGILLWAPLHTLFVGQQSTWKRNCLRGRQWHAGATKRCDLVGRHCRNAGSKIRELALNWWPALYGAALEGVCGGLLGGMLTYLAGLSAAIIVAAAVVGCAAGAAVGFNSRGRN
jgi:hypothetical protein